MTHVKGNKTCQQGSKMSKEWVILTRKHNTNLSNGQIVYKNHIGKYTEGMFLNIKIKKKKDFYNFTSTYF